MVEKTIQEQIVREAPEIEALKLGLIQSAKDLSDTQIQLPEQQIAGLTGLHQSPPRNRLSQGPVNCSLRPICPHTQTRTSNRLLTPLLPK